MQYDRIGLQMEMYTLYKELKYSITSAIIEAYTDGADKMLFEFFSGSHKFRENKQIVNNIFYNWIYPLEKIVDSLVKLLEKVIKEED